MEQGSQKKILIVDDDLSFSELLCQILKTKNYAVEAVHNGFDGIERAKLILPAGIILDFRLPDMNGFDFCLLLKESSHTSSIPVMVVSGFQKKADDRVLKKLGIGYYMEKPFKNSEFLDAVADLIGKGSS